MACNAKPNEKPENTLVGIAKECLVAELIPPNGRWGLHTVSNETFNVACTVDRNVCMCVGSETGPAMLISNGLEAKERLPKFQHHDWAGGTQHASRSSRALHRRRAGNLTLQRSSRNAQCVPGHKWKILLQFGNVNQRHLLLYLSEPTHSPTKGRCHSISTVITYMQPPSVLLR